MPRIARLKHDNAVYHIMVRGNNRENIFFDQDDKVRYLQTVKRYKEKFQVYIYAYCLMDNHAHLIVDCNGQDISKIMHGINLSYTQYFNRKYSRCGHLFQDRFKSKIIDRDTYIIEASKYIHYNPVEAGICKSVLDYKWSSMNIYTGRMIDVLDIVSIDLILMQFSDNKVRAIELYIQYVDSSIAKISSEIEKAVYENRDRKVALQKVDINKVLFEVAKQFDICVEDITARCGKRFRKARQIAAYIIYLKSKVTYKEIGERFGITSSAVGQCIKKAVETVMTDRDVIKAFNLTY